MKAINSILRTAVGERIENVVSPRVIQRGKPAQLVVGRAVLKSILQSRFVEAGARKLCDAKELYGIIGRQSGSSDRTGDRREKANPQRPFR